MILEEAISVVQGCPAAYVLKGAGQEYYYKGSCRNLIERLKDHRAGRVSRTKNRRPLELMYVEYFDEYKSALAREKWLKTGAGRAYLKDFLAARVAKWQTQRT